MDKAALVEADIDGGAELIRALDQSGLPVQAALWFYSADEQEWYLMIATTIVDKFGPRRAYRDIRRIMQKEQPPFSVAFGRIKAVSPSSRLIQLLRCAVKTGKALVAIRFSQNTINGEYIEDAVLYRLQ